MDKVTQRVLSQNTAQGQWLQGASKKERTNHLMLNNLTLFCPFSLLCQMSYHKVSKCNSHHHSLQQPPCHEEGWKITAQLNGTLRSTAVWRRKDSNKTTEEYVNVILQMLHSRKGPGKSVKHYFGHQLQSTIQYNLYSLLQTGRIKALSQILFPNTPSHPVILDFFFQVDVNCSTIMDKILLWFKPLPLKIQALHKMLHSSCIWFSV